MMIMDIKTCISKVYRSIALADPYGKEHDDDDDEDAPVPTTMTRASFDEIRDVPDAVQAFEKIGVEEKHYNALAAVLFEQSDELSFEDFLYTVVRLRPEKRSSVMDIAAMRYALR